MDNCMKIAYKSWPISTVISYSMKIFEVINVFFNFKVWFPSKNISYFISILPEASLIETLQ